jgi:hypothetical protein
LCSIASSPEQSKALAPVNGAMVNALAVVLVFDSAFGVIKGVVA